MSTKFDAYKSLGKPVARTLRKRVFRWIAQQEEFGATNEEISKSTDMRLQTVCARRNELGKKLLVVDSGRRRATESGRNAIVWIVPKYIRARFKETA